MFAVSDFKFPARLLAAGVAFVLAAAMVVLSSCEARAHDNNLAAFHTQKYPLHEAIKNSVQFYHFWDEDPINHLLVVHMMDVNKMDAGGRSPLHWAASLGRADIVKRLLEAGAAANAASIPSGKTPLDLAIARGHKEVAAILRGTGNSAPSRLDKISADSEATVHIGEKIEQGKCPMGFEWSPDIGNQGMCLFTGLLSDFQATMATMLDDKKTPNPSLQECEALGKCDCPMGFEWDPKIEACSGKYKLTTEEAQVIASVFQAPDISEEMLNMVEMHAILGMAYYDGKGVSQNYAEAVKWLRRAAEWGHVHAQYNLGVMYSQGKGVPQNYSEAYVWYSLAAASGIKAMAKWRDLTAQLLSPADLSSAQKDAARRHIEIQREVDN